MQTYVEVDLNVIKNNTKEILNKYSNYKYYIGVLKANAYGHGPYVVNALVDSGINYIATFTLDEAINVRKFNKDIPILILQPVDISKIKIVIDNSFALTVCDITYLKQLISLNQFIKIHLKLDTGMNRLGFNDEEEFKLAYDLILENSNVYLEGIYSHFATTGILDCYWDSQVKRFQEMTRSIDLSKIPMVHMGSSLNLIMHPKLDFCNTVRLGTILYGYNLSYKLGNNFKDKLRKIRNNFIQKYNKISLTYYNVDLNLSAAFSFYTSIVQIKKVKKGQCVGYNLGYKADKDILIAVLPVGYSNGLSVHHKYVVIKGKKYNIVGHICMNMCCVEIDEQVELYDKVMLIGEKLTAGTFGRMNNMSIHEAIIKIGSLNKHRYVSNKKIDYED